jgi:hypothetical protein
MFNSSKSPLRSFAAAFGFGGMQSDDEDEAERDESRDTDPKVSRLRRVLADLKAGEPQSEVPRAQAPAPKPPPPVPAATETPRAEKATVQAAPPVRPAPVPAAPPTIDTAKVSAAKADTAALPAQNGVMKVETAMPKDVLPKPAVNGEAITTAQSLVAEQRRVVESLLVEVRALEDRLNNEVSAAKAEDDFRTAKDKAVRMAELERQANEALQAASARHDTVLAEQKEAQTQAVAARADADSAQARVTELEQQLKDAQLTAAQALSLATQREAAAKECGEKESAAQRDLVDATDRVTACRADSAAAQSEAGTAQATAETLKKQLPPSTQNLAGVGDVQALATRIAQHVSALATNGAPSATTKIMIGGA